jgi:hypothetical protein
VRSRAQNSSEKSRFAMAADCREAVNIEGACFMGSTGMNRRLYLGFWILEGGDIVVLFGEVESAFSFRLLAPAEVGVVVVVKGCGWVLVDIEDFIGVVKGMSGNIVVDAASVAVDEKLLHLVIIHRRNSLCK